MASTRTPGAAGGEGSAQPGTAADHDDGAGPMFDTAATEPRTPGALARAIVREFEALDEDRVEHLPRAYVLPESLHEYPWNPRKPLSAERYARLLRGIEKFGLVGGLAVRDEDSGLIGGHQRLRACRELLDRYRDDPVKLRAMNLPDGRIPVDRIRGLSLQDAQALNVLFNNKEAQSDYAFGPLRDLVSDLDAFGYDATLTGFDTPQLESLLTWEPDINADAPTKRGKRKTTETETPGETEPPNARGPHVHTCPECGHTWDGRAPERSE